jgi:UDP-glucuronate decarboxylase
MRNKISNIADGLPRRSVRVTAKRKRILVTGGAGFLGSHLCERLIARGDAVVCLDNFSTSDERNIAPFKASGAFRLLKQDVIEPCELDVDQIYNLACAASPPRYQLDPIHTLKTNVLGAINVLDLAVRTGARIFQASTSEVYGDPEVHPQPEGYWGRVNSFGPRACYDEGKRSAETLFYDYHHRKGVDIRIARIFNTYGPRMSAEDGRVVSNFIVQALSGERITIYGDGSQTRSFCFVDDLIDGIVQLMDAPDPMSRPINLGNSAEFTIRELAEIVFDIIGSARRIEHLPLPQDDPRQRRPDLTLAQQTLGWGPKVPLKEGLRRTIAYFDEILSARSARVKEYAI